MHVMLAARAVPSKQTPLFGIFEWDQACALAKAGHQVSYLAVDIRSIRRKRKLGYQTYQQDGVQVFSMAFPIGRLPMAVRSAIGERIMRWLYKKALQTCGKPDLIHAHFPYIAIMAMPTSRKNHIPFVVTEHYSSLMSSAENSISRIVRRVYPCAAQLVAVSPALRDRLWQRFHYPVRFIPNMIDTTLFYPPERTPEQTPFIFVSVGRFDIHKRHEWTIRAFAQLRREGIDARLWMFGGGDRLAPCKALAAEMNVADDVVFFGMVQRKEISDRMRAAHAFVLPSESETFGVAYVEAMACGLPVVSTKCGGPESFVNESNGILIEVNDEKALTNAMRDISTGRAVFDRTRIAAQVRDVYSPERVLEALESVYRQATAPHALLLAQDDDKTAFHHALCQAHERMPHCDLIVVKATQQQLEPPQQMDCDGVPYHLLTLDRDSLCTVCAALLPQGIFYYQNQCQATASEVARLTDIQPICLS